jgi:hypothetical protein
MIIIPRRSFAVANTLTNTEKANSTATVGKIPAYIVMDLNLSYVHQNRFFFKAGVACLLIYSC